MGKRVGVMGGTFDPIHVGHLTAAEWAREECRLDQVLFVPAGVPPHKEAAEVSPARHRLIMTELAVLANPAFAVSRVDVERRGKSYTVETIAALRKELPEGTELFFIMGADSLADIPTWHEPDRLLSSCQFIVTTRPGWEIDRARELLGDLYVRHAERIRCIEIPAIDVSSRMIRERLRRGGSARYLVPDLVLRYIQDRNVYERGNPK